MIMVVEKSHNLSICLLEKQECWWYIDSKVKSSRKGVGGWDGAASVSLIPSLKT